MVSKKIPDISFAIHHCEWFNYFTKAPHETEVKKVLGYHVKGWFEITEYNNKIDVSIINLVETTWLSR